MQRFDDRMPMNSISYSMIQTERSPEYSDDSCTCGHDEMAFGDGLSYSKRVVNHKHFLQNFSKVESNFNYGTATEHELNAPYPKQVADRYEAEYDYCMRWACDYKYVAARVIPFQSNFYSVVRLMFHGKSWALDCANFDGQYDYCGWLPSVSGPQNLKKSVLTDSSELSHLRVEAGRTLQSSDTGYGLQSLKTDYSECSGLTKDPIDSDVYNVMGTVSKCEEIPIKQSLHSTFENLSPILKNEMAHPSESIISTGSSLKEVFHDLVELDHIFDQQVQEAQTQQSSLEDYVNCLTTAHSFSDLSLHSNYVVIDHVAPKTQTMLSQLICLTGKKFSVAFWKNWSKSKN
ncbi:hypothetical protein GCK72_014024 [Caenorhabditis remanei]|uniref:Uncharacterized protein n=1 Tax=Caenorhabditis remanei TaxID=31234 RepID=A0A6A5GQ44_CAERE|nr:hypothetical protein GCK72_014024 [Caenorhabditis remanei]KAF1757568.1 hypothetical protein GCK72_014024 [Caenorhabditis remanei]